MSDHDGEKKTLMRKGDYARARGRSPQALSGWIKDGKLTPPAIEGEGRAAMIWAEEADRQLGNLLDTTQQVAQAKPAIGAATNDEAARLAKARADQAELELARNRARFEEESGTYMVTADAKAAWAAETGRHIQELELWMAQDLAAAIAGEVEAPIGKVRAMIKASFREFRVRQAAQSADAAAAMPDGAEMANAA